MKYSSSLLVAGLALVTLMLSSVDAQCPKESCKNCNTRISCDGADPASAKATESSCPEKEACIMLGTTASCKPIAETQCNCNGKAMGCDPFDTAQQIFCSSGQMFLADDKCGDQKTCSGEGQCSAADTSPTPESLCVAPAKTGYYVFPPKCTTGVFCVKNKVFEKVQCKDTEYYNVTSNSCKPFPFPNPCGCGKVKCPIISSCSKYAVCDGATLLAENFCTADNKTKFNFDKQACEAAAVGPCSPYDKCSFPVTTPTTTPSVTTTATTVSSPGSITTPSSVSSTASSVTSSPASSSSTTATPPTTVSTTTTTTKPKTCNAANANKRYPHETDCKKYYTCRLITGSSYGYVAATCIAALVFNPASSYCDLRDNVPACKQ